MIKRFLILSLMMFSFAAGTMAQDAENTKPKFWFGVAGAADYNMFSGTTQIMNPSFTSQNAFHEGSGFAPFGAIHLEYRPTSVWGIMLNLGYDGRGGAFDGILEPCNCPADMTTNLSYLVIEPSLRIAPFSNGFYLFLGGAYNYNLNKSFDYTREAQVTNPPLSDASDITEEGDFSEMRSSSFSTQVGMGYDIPLSSASSRTQVELSPFVSFHPYFGHAPRTIESWSLQTVRAGIALKFGRTRAPKVVAAAPVVVPVVVVVEPDADFNINAPAKIQVKRVIKESFPIRNSVFFSENSSAIPGRYIQLTSQQASAFEENKSQEARPENVDGRSKRQLTAYYNVLNILGDRMRANPMAQVTLVGSSAGKGAAKGKEYAESVKRYLVNVYEISPARLTTEGRNLPVHPSQQPGASIDLVMLGDDDRRVDIVSASSALLVPIQFSTVHQDEGMVMFNTKAKEETNIKSWTVDVIDPEKKVQHFGPFTGDVASIRGNDILGDRPEGTYKVIMNAQTEEGSLIRKESTLSLVQENVVEQNEHKYSILFDFDKSETVASYEKFLNEVVSPQIMDNASVMIQGHSDTIGSEKYNLILSQQRAKDAQTILEKALVKAGTKGVTFQSVGNGDNTNSAPFSNNLPEGRFYNRTVIIDIVLVK